VVDEREELFPPGCGFDTGPRTDILSGCRKATGIDMVLRTMGPELIAMDEITSTEDCDALEQALWCGVRLVATVHAASKRDLLGRSIYSKLVRSGLFDTLIVLQRDKSWSMERM
jgi:stage III sporulation protein AA